MFGQQVKAMQKSLEGGLCRREAASAGAGDGVEALGATAALGSGIAGARGEQALGLEALECGVEGAGGGRAVGAGLEFVADADPVGRVAEPKGREEDQLLEFTEWLLRAHNNYKVVQMVEKVQSKMMELLRVGEGKLQCEAKE